MSLQYRWLATLAALAIPAGLSAHHSFAVFDFETQILFEGTVETLKFRNPHIAMTLKSVNENGESVIVDFIEGAPANMLVRNGLRPDMIAPGTRITAYGSPLIEDPDKYFLRRIVLENGEEFQ